MDSLSKPAASNPSPPHSDRLIQSFWLPIHLLPYHLLVLLQIVKVLVKASLNFMLVLKRIARESNNTSIAFKKCYHAGGKNGCLHFPLNVVYRC